MKLTKEQLKRIIKEELGKVLSEDTEKLKYYTKNKQKDGSYKWVFYGEYSKDDAPSRATGNPKQMSAEEAEKANEELKTA